MQVRHQPKARWPGSYINSWLQHCQIPDRQDTRQQGMIVPNHVGDGVVPLSPFQRDCTVEHSIRQALSLLYSIQYGAR